MRSLFSRFLIFEAHTLFSPRLSSAVSLLRSSSQTPSRCEGTSEPSLDFQSSLGRSLFLAYFPTISGSRFFRFLPLPFAHGGQFSSRSHPPLTLSRARCPYSFFHTFGPPTRLPLESRPLLKDSLAGFARRDFSR